MKQTSGVLIREATPAVKMLSILLHICSSRDVEDWQQNEWETVRVRCTKHRQWRDRNMMTRVTMVRPMSSQSSAGVISSRRAAPISVKWVVLCDCRMETVIAIYFFLRHSYQIIVYSGRVYNGRLSWANIRPELRPGAPTDGASEFNNAPRCLDLTVTKVSGRLRYQPWHSPWRVCNWDMRVCGLVNAQWRREDRSVKNCYWLKVTNA
jgi:hypothetical protein